MVIRLSAITVKKELNSSIPHVLIINGSPKKDGVTQQFINAFLEKIPSSFQTDVFDCYANSPLPCDDCRFCYHNNGCSKPDLNEFYAILEDADILVWATPVYNLSFPAPMKALIDRLQRYWASRFVRNMRPPINKVKRSVLLTCAGADDISAGAFLEKQLSPVLTIINATLVQSVHYSGADQKRPLRPALDRIGSLAEALC